MLRGKIAGSTLRSFKSNRSLCWDLGKVSCCRVEVLLLSHFDGIGVPGSKGIISTSFGFALS